MTSFSFKITIILFKTSISKVIKIYKHIINIYMPCLGSDCSNSLDNSVFTYLEISKILMMLFVGPKYICSALFDELITFF